MGNKASHEIQGEHVQAKLQNGEPNGHALSISSEDTVACDAAVQQNSEVPSSLLTKGTSPPPGEDVDSGRNQGKGSSPVVLLKVSTTVPPSTDVPADPSLQSVSINISTKETTSQSVNPEQDTPAVPVPASNEEEPKEKAPKKTNLFDKLLKKKNKDKTQEEATVAECDGSAEVQEPAVEAPVIVSNGLHSEPGDAGESTAAAKEVPEGPSPNGGPAGSETLDADSESAHPEDTAQGESLVEESPVMNFFKTLVTPSKTPKEEGAPPAVSTEEVKGGGEPEGTAKAETSAAAVATAPAPPEPPKEPRPAVKISVASPFSKLFKGKSSKEVQPATTTVTQEVDASAAAKAAKPPPPPPPPEPPKPDAKGEVAAKTVNSTQKEAPKEAPKEPETSTKQKSAKGSPFLSLFRPTKTEEVEEEPQPVEEEVPEIDKAGASKEKTAEVPAAPDQPSKTEEKKSGKSIISFFKPKSVQKEENHTKADGEVPDSTSPEAKAKESTSAGAAIAVDASQSVQAKVEPKPSAEAEKKVEVAPVDNRSVSEASQTGEDTTVSVGKKLEKRNSIHMFFKSLGPKRLSDTGVQTDPVTITYPAEKAK
ncbi:breast carcinoma-amplified sequence 1 isoform X2 [Megalops cyprinoides]|uniref:breast carcinoma-amplified sequence 1 isoform X2 n=1 Tax=Megalops cyprinoides TaxID=118141 RepID=UPI001863AF2D|nr:breast carcinoma-amplified sequence 1 isoform X2 [Megalops cyprinoides]